MRATFTAQGDLIVTGETPLEAYAIKKWKEGNAPMQQHVTSEPYYMAGMQRLRIYPSEAERNASVSNN